ncbi:hypothetical protein HHI36_003200 [Cryptolaemus montrouzieri]|uniref:GDNF/GAS1 domain-containing protein n=1 Tax=Cryptolaemus montrouzieri TaxID=559131 RepID=A0ABD2PCR9_9CUCU
MWWIMLSVAAIVGAVDTLSCEEARMKCAYRVGCGRALQNYAMDCSTVLQGAPPTHCPEFCQHSLIALTSTDEGKKLMECECSDEFCEEQKRRVEICRPQVMKQVNEPVLPCRVAQWICVADTMCSTALDYYNELCRSMFHGKKCTTRCNNSIAILRRQEKAAKLTTCRCDGTEDFDCRAIQKNMERLCFHKHQRPHHGDRNKNETVHHREKVVPPVLPTIPPSVIEVENPNSSTINRVNYLLFIIFFSFFIT